MPRRFGPALDGAKIALLLVIGLVLARLTWLWIQPTAPETLAEGRYQVARVVDGDTLLLANGARIRLIGVDTPETVRPQSPVEPWGPEAAAFTRNFIGTGLVELRFDRERLDRHGRFLAYVFVDGRLLNEDLVKAGLARAKLAYHYSDTFKRRFKTAQAEAQSARRGLWSEEKPDDEDPEIPESGEEEEGQ